MTPIFQAKIENGKVVFTDREAFDGYIAGLEGKACEVTVRKFKRSRTNLQNNYYWGAVIKLSAGHFGYTPEEMHEALKFLFLRKHEEGKPETVRSTATLTTIEFTAYIEQCRQFAAEEGIYIPDPEEIDYQGKDEDILKAELVDNETLKQIFGWTIKGIQEEHIMEICRNEFNGKEPRELTKIEAERLETLIIAELK